MGKILVGLFAATVVALAVVVAMMMAEASPERAAAERAANEARASQAAAQAAQAQAALESARYAGQAQLALTSAQADVLRTNAAMPTLVLALGGIGLIATPLVLVLVLVLARRSASVSSPLLLPPLPPTIILLTQDGPRYLLQQPGQSRGEYLRFVSARAQEERALVER